MQRQRLFEIETCAKHYGGKGGGVGAWGAAPCSPGNAPVENSRLQHWCAQIQSRTIACGLNIKNYSFLFSRAGQLVTLGK